MNKILIFLLTILQMNFICLAHDATTSNKFKVKINNSGKNVYKKIRLTSDIYHHCNADLSDLRIYNSKQEDVIFLINSASMVKNPNSENRIIMSKVATENKENKFNFDYKVYSTALHTDLSASRIGLKTSSDTFVKKVDIYGSTDGESWSYVTSDTLYKFQGYSKLFLDLKNQLNYTYYRMQVDNNLENIEFSDIWLTQIPTKSKPSYFKETLLPKYEITKENDETIITIKDVKHLKLDTITIESPTIFEREFISQFGKKTLYNLNYKGNICSDKTLSFNNNLITSENLTLRIKNSNQDPIQIDGIHLTYNADELVFRGAEEGDLTLEFSGNPNIKAPTYYMDAYRSNILKLPIDLLMLGKLKCSYEKITPAKAPSKWSFNILVLVFSILLALFFFLEAKRKKHDKTNT